MISEFSNLRQSEIDTLLDAPVYVAILIAGADGDIDEKEIKRACVVARAPRSGEQVQLTEYYNEVGLDFENKIHQKLESLPKSVEKRTGAIVNELRKLNFILPQISNHYSIHLVASLKDMAMTVAKASGGILGLLSVSKEEAELVELDMIKDPSTYASS